MEQIIFFTKRKESFTGQTGIPVTVRLVASTALLPSVLAGNGPDVALSNEQSVAVDYAARGAAASLSGFEGLNEVLARFADSAIQPFYYNGELYGIPESQTWPMLFCRMDILAELGLQIPQTWDEIVAAIPVIQRKSMDFGMLVGYPGYLQLLYQNGGSLYRNGDTVSTALDTNEAIAAFTQFCNLFTQYKLPIEYDAANRFRSGEMPLLIADYTLYNQLTVFAPEISGQWEMTTLPGVEQADGNIDKTSVSTTKSVIILSDAKKPDQAWEFVKWWTSADVQIAFGVEMEAVLGPSAKQPTANLEAMEGLPWTSSEYSALQLQQSLSVGLQVIPGYYQAERLVGFAFNNVYSNNTDPAEELEDTILSINTELKRRQNELSGRSGKETDAP